MTAAFDLGPLRLMSVEFTLFLTAISALVADIAYRGSRPKFAATLSIAGFSIALLFLIATFDSSVTELFSKTLFVGPITQYFKALIIFAGMAVVIMGWVSREIHASEKAEMQVMVILATLGMCLMCSAAHFLVLFLAFEMVGVSCYVLAAFKKRSPLSSEAGVKFFVHGALTSILFVVGVVMLYGVSHTFNILEIHGKLSQSGVSIGYLWVAFGLIFTAIATRMAVFPFHFLAPDVIEGAPSPVSAFFAVSTPLAAMAVALRLCLQVFSTRQTHVWAPLDGFFWPQLVAAAAAATMTLGNLTAIFQTNLKRLIGYCCVAQMGSVLMGLVVLNDSGIAALLFSLVSYTAVMLGTFFIIQLVTDQAKNEDISVLRGLVWKRPFEGTLLCIFLVSVAGIPPLAGFVSKFYILSVIIEKKIYWLAIVTAVNWVIGLSYSLLMLKQIFAPKPRADESLVGFAGGPLVHTALGVLLLPAIALGIYWDPLVNTITRFLDAVQW